MKAIGIVGSPRKNGNTEVITAHTLRAIEEEGIGTELITLAGLDIRGCTACMACQKEETCPIDDDLLPIYAKMKESDAIVLASPVYYGSATALLKALMERTGFISTLNGRVFDFVVIFWFFFFISDKHTVIFVYLTFDKSKDWKI